MSVPLTAVDKRLKPAGRERLFSVGYQAAFGSEAAVQIPDNPGRSVL
jgi:hypothetical protein